MAELLSTVARPPEPPPLYGAAAHASALSGAAVPGSMYGPVLTYKTASALYQPSRFASDPALSSHLAAGAAEGPLSASRAQPRTAIARRVHRDSFVVYGRHLADLCFCVSLRTG